MENDNDNQENDDQQTACSEHESSSGSIGQCHRQSDISYEELGRLILSLNFQQRKIFNEVQDWAKKKIKARNSFKKVSVDPLRFFITEGAGVGRSHLMKTICMFLTNTFNLYSRSPDKPKVLIPASTGVAAININGTTINSGFSTSPLLMHILCQGFEILNEEDSEIYIMRYWFPICACYIYIKSYVKYLTLKKINHLKIYLFLW